jgi:cobalt-zinc-cadmium efflux system membrane fusion protein
MKMGKNHVMLGAGIVLAVAAVVGVRQVEASREAAAIVPVKEKREPGVVRFAAGAPQLSMLRIMPAEVFPLPVAEPVSGRITYDENVTARVSSSIAGRVVKIAAEIGDRVPRNAVLAQIDSPDLASAEADWRKAQADETRKKLAWDRSKDLYEHEVLARKDYESAQADYQQAVAETRRAVLRMKNLNASGVENGVFNLRTPIAGIVADRQINPGLEVRPDLQNPLFVITDIQRLWVIADVPERSIGNIKPGQDVSIETDAYPDERFEARVDRVGIALDPGTRRVQVRCTVANPKAKLKPEMFVRIHFLADGSKKAVRLPNTALFVEGIHTHAYVEKSPGVFEKRRVTVALRDSTESYIDSGIAAGERVVTEGALLLNSEASGGADAQ